MRRIRPLVLAALALAAGCASPSEIPGAETPFLRAKLDEAAGLPDARNATVPLPGAVAVPVRAPSDEDPVAGLLDLAEPRIAGFVNGFRTGADATLAAPLDADLVVAAVWVRNPAVAAARSGVDAARRTYEQAAWIDDLETRFRSLAVPAANVRETMAAAPLAYPGTAALRGEMLDRAASMAAARVRMVFLETSTDALRAFHDAAHHAEEAAIRREQLAVLDRLVGAARSRVESGRAPQAELSEAEAERAMVADDVAHADASLIAARRKLNAFLDRAPDAPLAIADRSAVTPGEPDSAPLLELARRASPVIRMARAEAAMLGAAERMARRMVNPSTGPVSPVAAAMDADGAAPMAASPESAAVPPAWAAEIAARRVAAEFAVAESVRRVERDVAAAVYDVGAMARMFRVASESTEPATRQALEERLRLFEGGRGEFPSVLIAFRRHLEALHDIAQARHDHAVAQSMLVMAVGARPGGDLR